MEAVSPATARLSGQLVIQAVLWFNFVFCLANAQHWRSASATDIIVTQVLLLGVSLVLARSLVSPRMVACAALVIGVVLASKLVNQGLDLKILFDLAVPPAFLVLGRLCPPAHATVVLRNVLVCVVVVGCVEMAAPSWYQGVMSIWDYYVSKGTIAPDTFNFTGTSFIGNGERSEQAGRTLLPWLLSNHRAGSVFLESVSAGNFPIVCLAWLLSVRIPKRSLLVAMGAMTVTCIVLPDSRFALICCMGMVAFKVCTADRSPVVAAALPLVVVLTMWVAGSLVLAPGELPQIQDDDFTGRLLFSSKLLAYWDWQHWLGFAVSPVYVADTGYAYLINNTGLPAILLLWLVFALGPAPSGEAVSMRGMISVYYTASLAINSSVFSIKTAALLWFLYGAACTARSWGAKQAVVPGRVPATGPGTPVHVRAPAHGPPLLTGR